MCVKMAAAAVKIQSRERQFLVFWPDLYHYHFSNQVSLVHAHFPLAITRNNILNLSRPSENEANDNSAAAAGWRHDAPAL